MTATPDVDLLAQLGSNEAFSFAVSSVWAWTIWGPVKTLPDYTPPPLSRFSWRVLPRKAPQNQFENLGLKLYARWDLIEHDVSPLQNGTSANLAGLTDSIPAWYISHMGDPITGIVGIAIAAPPLIYPIKDSIAAITKLLSDYRHFDSHLERTLLQLEAHLTHVGALTQFAHDNFGSFTDNAKALFHRLVRVLEALLADFQIALGDYCGTENGRLKKLGFAFRGRKLFKKFDDEMRDWERRFNDIVFITVLASGRKIPSALTASRQEPQPSPALQRLLDMIAQTFTDDTTVTTSRGNLLQLPLSTFYPSACTPIAYSSVIYHPSTPSEPAYLLETHVRTSATAADVQGIASFLSSSEPSITSLLRCAGYHGHTLKYLVPAELEHPISLRSALLYDGGTAPPKHPLDERVHLMKRLASAVLWVHVAGHVHKSIRADNIVLFGPSQADDGGGGEPDGFPATLGTPFLLGFDLSRASGAASSRERTAELQKAYYLTPDLRGGPERRYTLRDDVYALGVVFLELALWTSFSSLQRDERSGEERWCRNRALVDDKGAVPPEKLRQRFIGMARKDVRRKMGTTVSEVIVACLEEWVDTKEGEGEIYVKRVLGMLDLVSL